MFCSAGSRDQIFHIPILYCVWVVTDTETLFCIYWSFSHLNCPFIIFCFGVAITFSFSLFFLLWKNFKLWKVATVQRTPHQPCINMPTFYHAGFIILQWAGAFCAHPLSYSKGAGYVYAPSPHNILVHSIKASMFFTLTPV